MSKVLQISSLHVAIDGKEILKGVDLTLRQGEIHALMGPNGSGKSTLSYALMGHPNYEVTEGSATLDGEMPALPPDVVGHHLRGCGECRAWDERVRRLHRSLRLQPAAPEPDRTDAILAALPTGRRVVEDRVTGLRILTLIIAIVQLVATVPLLLASDTVMAGNQLPNGCTTAVTTATTSSPSVATATRAPGAARAANRTPAA